MGISKTYIDKEYILLYLKNENITHLVRLIRIESLFKSELLVMDKWSSKFYSGLNPEEREIRKALNEKYKFDSSNSFVNDEDFKNLVSLSETLISLYDNASWIDIFLTVKKLNLKIEDSRWNNYMTLKNTCIESIINYFDS